jgi:ketosteroid isomerase-like protein
MRHVSVVVVAIYVVMLAACGPRNHDADEAAIREANKNWLAAIAIKDSVAIGALYADDGQMMPPNMARFVGRDPIQRGWSDLMGLPGFSLNFETEKFYFAKSGDLAVDIGKYKLTVGEGPAALTDTGKFVVTWTKRDGKWLVLTDMFSSDLPPPPAAAAAAPPAAVEGATPAVTPDTGAPATTPTTPIPTPTAPAPATPTPTPGTP